MKKRILGILLAVMLISSVLPVQAVVVELSTDIANGSWVCVDEALRIKVEQMPVSGYDKINAYLNGSEKVVATGNGTSSVVLVIPKDTLLPGDNTVSFKAFKSSEQVGDTQSIIINGFKPLNSTVISETDFNDVTGKYKASYDATLTSDGWTYDDYNAQSEKLYKSPEDLYGCDTVRWDAVSDGGHQISRVSHSDNNANMYLQYVTDSTETASTRTPVEFLLHEKPQEYPNKIMKISMDVYTSGGTATIANATSYVQDGTVNCKLQPFNGIASGWVHVVAYFDPENKKTICKRNKYYRLKI